ncbi:hypothetical protein EC991_003053 [Linnemannia zychae]|nr:hypothetical protein EC991_003053 [Linnemannia zychae]
MEGSSSLEHATMQKPNNMLSSRMTSIKLFQEQPVSSTATLQPSCIVYQHGQVLEAVIGSRLEDADLLRYGFRDYKEPVKPKGLDKNIEKWILSTPADLSPGASVYSSSIYSEDSTCGPYIRPLAVPTEREASEKAEGEDEDEHPETLLRRRATLSPSMTPDPPLTPMWYLRILHNQNRPSNMSNVKKTGHQSNDLYQPKPSLDMDMTTLPVPLPPLLYRFPGYYHNKQIGLGFGDAYKHSNRVINHDTLESAKASNSDTQEQDDSERFM